MTTIETGVGDTVVAPNATGGGTDHVRGQETGPQALTDTGGVDHVTETGPDNLCVEEVDRAG